MCLGLTPFVLRDSPLSHRSKALPKLPICILRPFHLLKHLTKYLKVLNPQAAPYLQISAELTVAFLS